MEVIEDQPPKGRESITTAERLARLEGIVNAALELEAMTGEMHPVNLDDVWRLMGYSSKGNSVRALLRDQTMIKGSIKDKYLIFILDAKYLIFILDDKYLEILFYFKDDDYESRKVMGKTKPFATYHLKIKSFGRWCCSAPNVEVRHNVIRFTNGASPVQTEIARMEVIEDQHRPRAGEDITTAERLARLEGIVNAALELEARTGEMHPVNLDDVWRLMGWSTKSNAVSNLKHISTNMIEGTAILILRNQKWIIN
jgi:hypothetical protein